MNKQSTLNKPFEVSSFDDVFDSLVSEPLTQEDNIDTCWIEIEKITPANHQPRSFFSQDKLQELANSFSSQGFKGAINVREKYGLYEIVAGERRYRAAQIAGLKKVRCIIDDYSDEDAYEFAMRENLNRENLSKLEEVEGILHLITLKYKIPRNEIVRLVQSEGNKVKRERNVSLSPKMKQITEVLSIFGGQLETFRSKYLALLNLPESLRNAHLKGSLSYNHVIELKKIKDIELRQQLLSEVLADQLSVRATKKRIKTLLNPSKVKAQRHASTTPPKAVMDLWKQMISADVWDGENIERLMAVMEEILGIRDR